MSNIDASRLGRLVIAGLIAGVLTFLVINPRTAREEAEEARIWARAQERLDRGEQEGNVAYDLRQQLAALQEQRGNPYVSGILLNGSFAVLLGGLLILFEEFGSPPKRVGLRILVAAGIAAVLGAISGLTAQAIYGGLAPAPFEAHREMLKQVLARALGWLIVGTGAGIAVGAALGSARRVVYCGIAGLIGGFVGGLVFDGIGHAVGGGSLSRLIGFTLMGALIGAAIVFVEDIAKQSWVTILSGAKEGRSFILSKPVTTIGRDELADIPLFGDPSITKQHAVLQMDRSNVAIQGAVAVNGAPTQYAQLRDSDIVQVGRIAMRFHQKATAGAYQPAQYQPWQQAPYSAPPQPTLYGPQQTPVAQPVGVLVLSLSSGPHAGASFRFDSGPVRIGREVDCQIMLAQDGMVSRRHAEIARTGVTWTVSDVGSTNGTYVNGARVAQQALNIGDVVSVGQTAMRVDGV